MKNAEYSITFKIDIAKIYNTPNILSQTSIKNFRKNSPSLDVVEMNKNFSSIPPVNAAIEVMNYIFGHLNSEKAKNVSSKKAIEIKHLLMHKLMSNYPYESYKNHELLKNYEIIQRPGFFEYILDGESIKWIPDKIIPISPDMLTKIQMMSLAFQCTILNRHNETAKEILKYIITATNLYFNHFAKEFEQYTKYAEYLLPVLKLIEPESQLKIVQALVPYIKFSLDLSGKFSDLLIENKNFEDAKALLDESIFSLNNNTEDQILALWYYRTGRAYEETGNYDISTKCYKHAFKLLPSHETIACHLWSNYRIQGEFDKAKDLIQYVPEGYIKYFLEMLTNPYEISYKNEKLTSINKKTLTPFYSSLYDGCQYMAFYNKISNKQQITKKQQTKLTKKLDEIVNSSNNTSLAFSLALCTKQFKMASDLLNKMPEHQINLYEKALIKLQSYMDPNYTLPQNNTLNLNEKVEFLNAVNTSLIADNETKLTSEKSERIFQNVESALQNDSSNENTLEIGVVTALLNNNQEKVQEYASKLSQEKQEEIIASYSLGNKQIESFEQLIAQYDAKKIHQYYQLKKKHEFYLAIQKIIHFNNNSWNIPKEGQIKIDNQAVVEGTAIFLGQYRGFDCYGTISKKIYDRFDKSKITSFVSALKKGIIYHKHGVNGVKLIKENAFKAKWDCDDRLFTNILYFNEQGLLLNFDEYGNHAEVKKFISGHHLEFYNVE
ncbi:MAG: hypothetical protein RLZZ81_1048 [Pseudomonadota bacterium]|jgi:metal-responsive CopG/Arc/MetJ family transcriptional regulator